MDSLKKNLQCSVCMQQYDKDFHYPLVLSCGHNICPVSYEKLHQDFSIKCPLCKKSHSCNKIEGIPKNYALLSIIESLKQTTFLEIDNKNIKDEIRDLSHIISKIKQENSSIENFLDEHIKFVTQYKKDVIKYNKDLIDKFQTYQAIMNSDLDQIFYKRLNRTSLEELSQLDQVQKDLSIEIAELKNQMAEIEQVAFIKLDQIKETIQVSEKIDFKKLNDKGYLTKNEIVNDYTKFVESIHRSLQVHFTKKRNYQIKCETNIDLILQLLKDNAAANNTSSIICLGFMFFHGIVVEKSEILALNYFKKAASLGSVDATYMCYNLLNKYETKKYEYLAKSLFMQSDRAINQFGYLNETGKINQMPPSYKSAFQFYQKAAEMGCSVAFRNVALYLQNGYGVKKDLNEAAKWYQLAIEKGYWEAKEELDDIYEQTTIFKQKNPNYKKWDGDYQDFENQPVYLL